MQVIICCYITSSELRPLKSLREILVFMFWKFGNLTFLLHIFMVTCSFFNIFMPWVLSGLFPFFHWNDLISVCMVWEQNFSEKSCFPINVKKLYPIRFYRSKIGSYLFDHNHYTNNKVTSLFLFQLEVPFIKFKD